MHNIRLLILQSKFVVDLVLLQLVIRQNLSITRHSEHCLPQVRIPIVVKNNSVVFFVNSVLLLLEVFVCSELLPLLFCQTQILALPKVFRRVWLFQET